MPRAGFFPRGTKPQCPLCGWAPTKQVPGESSWIVNFRTTKEGTNILVECDQCRCESIWKTWVDDNSFNEEVDV